jgi:LPS-assembly protein
MGGRSIAHLLGAVFLVFFAIFFTAPPSIMAQESPSVEFDDLPTARQPTLISADEVVYDKKLDLVTARGNVEVSQGDRAVVADEVTYNLDTGTVSASGEVTLVEPSGNVVFADYIELSADLRDAFIRDVRILMNDNSRLAGASAERSEGRYVVLQKGVFSPCELCRTDPESAPLWQIKANQVIHDQEDKTIQYYDAWMEIFGVPVLYTPYFEHPDPTVKRKSGFLAPGFGASDTLGTTIQIPYFWAIDDTKDLTFEPLITTKQSIVLAGEYRQLFTKGFISIVGSGTIADREKDSGKTENDVLRGHIDAFARFDIDKHWRTGLDLQRTVDDTYLRLYDISAERTLTSRAFVERFDGRNYGAANAYLYQGLREKDDNNESPILAPLIDYNFVGEPGVVGGKYFADADLMVLSRIEGRDSRRVSLNGGYELPYTGPIGDVYSLVAKVQADGYWTDGVDPGNPNVHPSNTNGNDVTGRIFPQVGLTWRYPWVQSNESFQQVLEPIAQIVAAPTGGNPNEIPNEDSIGFEFDDTNLFNLNRFPGLDRVDSGTRVDYGLNWLGELGALGNSNLFAGQSYRITKPDQDIFTANSGVRDRLSDIVGRVQLNPIKELDLLYRFRLSKDDLRPLRHELSTKAGVPALKVNLSYIFIEGDENSERFGDREEITGKIKSRLTKNWSASFGHKRDLERNEPLSTVVSLSYENDCFLIEGVGQRKFFEDRELEPEDSIFIRFVFKYLGEFETR